jgi:hypothetical protein
VRNAVGRFIIILLISAALAGGTLVWPALVAAAPGWVAQGQVAGYSGGLLYIDRGQIARGSARSRRR